MDLVERRVHPQLVGFSLAPGAPGSIPSDRDLRPDYDQGQPRDLRDRELRAEQDHTLDERDDGRQVVPERGALLPTSAMSW